MTVIPALTVGLPGGRWRIDRAVRTVAATVLGAGLRIDAVAEPCADERTAAEHPEVADTRIAPHFMLVRARKP